MLCENQVVIVTGAGRGIGRAHALSFAQHGARVVVNDIGTSYSGEGHSDGPAHEVVAEIVASGGKAVVDTNDVADPEGARRIVQTALDEFGDLNTIVNNAGILRSKSIFEMTTEDMGSSLGVHLIGAFHLTKYGAEYWREHGGVSGSLNASVVNTSSAAGLWPSHTGDPTLGPMLTAYGSAKAAVAAFTIAASLELYPMGIRVNAIAPGGRTRMNTEAIIDLGGQGVPPPPLDGFDLFDPANVSPLVVWLSTPEAADVSGRVFESGAGKIGIANGWTHGPSTVRADATWDPKELAPIVRELIQTAPRPANMMEN
jgi:NAD(P)-dependent dehydrogenase (short-subunit alcohol dehydrogenase family)